MRVTPPPLLYRDEPYLSAPQVRPAQAAGQGLRVVFRLIEEQAALRKSFGEIKNLLEFRKNPVEPDIPGKGVPPDEPVKSESGKKIRADKGARRGMCIRRRI